MIDVAEIQKIIKPLLERNDVVFAGVFGSFARGEANEASDIDLLVRFRSPKSLLEIVRLEHELSALTGRKVEVVTEKFLHPYIAGSVRRDLQPLYGKG